ncbi:uncharacterized protein METZ01_LOCUS363031, partial [marine metagenome]
MSQVGRISGPLLKDNLLRNGIDLSFSNTLGTDYVLYLDVSTSTLGITKDVPATDLDNLGNTLRSTNFINDTVYSEPAWASLKHTLDNPNAYGTSTGDSFPSDNGVSISGDYAVVGARHEDSAEGTSAGHAYIFNVSTGALVHSIPNPNTQVWGESSDGFGWSVAIDGNYALIGAPREDTNLSNNDSGHVYVYNVSTGALLHTL